MTGRYEEPIDWRTPVIAFAIWAAHFSVLWGASSALPGDPAARWAALVATIIALAGLARLGVRRSQRGPRTVPRLGVALAAVAIGFGALPALVG